MSEINIRFATDETLSTIKGNLNKFTKIAKENPTDNAAFISELPDEWYVEKKYNIEDFQLSISTDGNYSKVDLQNAILLFEHLHKLPKHVLGDERFWLWLLLEKGYAAANQSMPMDSGKNVIKDHWLFGQGHRRGLMFGVLSRAYYRAELTMDETLDDKYELTKFATEKYERYRIFTWRAYSNNKKVVIAALKAEKQILDEYGSSVESIKDYYPEIGKFVSQLGSVMLIDMMSEEFIISRVKEYCEEMIAMETE